MPVDDPRFMSETHTEVLQHEAVRITHLPTGIVIEAPTRWEAVGKLGMKLSEEHPCYLRSFAPIPPVPAGNQSGERPELRQWQQYRVC